MSIPAYYILRHRDSWIKEEFVALTWMEPDAAAAVQAVVLQSGAVAENEGNRSMAGVTLSAILHKEDDLYVATCPELGTVSQGPTVEAALANLKEATELFLEEQREPVRTAHALLTTFSVDALVKRG